jgi:hypothetical protein
MVAGIALAVGGLLLIIATRWDSFGEGSQRRRMTGRDRAPAPDAG